MEDAEKARRSGATVTVELNGQQEKLLREIVAADPRGRSAEELIRHGFSEFAKRRRQQRA